MASKKLSNSTAQRSKAVKTTDTSKPSDLSTKYVDDSTSSFSDSDDDNPPPAKKKIGSHTLLKKPTKEQSKGKSGTAAGKKTQTTQIKGKVNGTRDEPASSDASDSGSSDSSESPPARQNTKHATIRTSQKQRSTEEIPQSTSGSGSEEDTSENETHNAKPDEAEPADVVMQDASEPTKHSSKVVVARPSFTPPAGFKAVSIPSNLNSPSIFTQENLAGKEIWHIVAPPNVPISSITAATLLQAQSQTQPGRFTPRETVATHKGAEYTLVEGDGQEVQQRAFRPNAGSESYSVCGPSISRVVRLQRKPLSMREKTVANESSVHEAESSLGSGPQQPVGLRMRYQPFGVSSDAHLSRINRSSELKSALSTGMESSQLSSEKRKSSASPSNDPVDHSPKTSTKRRKHEHSSPLRENSPAVAESNPEDAIIVAAQLQEERTETPEERAKRRAEKKREKEERRARKAERRARREADAAGAV